MFDLTLYACNGIIRSKVKGGRGGGEGIAPVMSFNGLELGGGGEFMRGVLDGRFNPGSRGP
jgi:hypothetical protein